VIEAGLGQRARRLGLDDEVGPRGQFRIGGAPGLRGKVDVDADLPTVVPPVEQAAAGSCVGRRHLGSARARSAKPDHRRAGLGEQLGREASAVVSQIDHPKALERT